MPRKSLVSKLIVLAALAWLPGPSAAETPPARSVTLDLSGLSDEGYRRIEGLSLEKAVLVRLVQEGFAVVGAPSTPDVVVGLSDTPESVRIAVASAAAKESLSVPIAGAPIPELQLELAQKIVELVRTIRLPPPAVPAPPAPIVVVVEPPAPPARAAPPGAVPPIQIAVSGGAVLRGGEFDFTLGAAAVVPLSKRLRFGAFFDRTSSASPRLDVVEVAAVAGPGWLLVDTGAFDVTVFAVLGALQHGYSFDDGGGGGDTGVRWDVAAAVPFQASLRSDFGGTVFARIVPELLGKGREHQTGGAVLWSRPGVGIAASVGAGWSFP